MEHRVHFIAGTLVSSRGCSSVSGSTETGETDQSHLDRYRSRKALMISMTSRIIGSHGRIFPASEFELFFFIRHTSFL